MSRPSLKTLREEAARLGCLITRTDGEFCVMLNRPADRQYAIDRAYYTDDASVALATLRALGSK